MSAPRLCGARTHAGGICKLKALKGTNRCRFHGGASPQAQAKALERLAQEAARKTLADLGEPIPPVTDALGALEALAGECLALTAVLRQMVGDLESIRYRGGPGSGGEQVRGELSSYIAMLGRSESVLSRLVALDLEGRRLRLDEAKAAFVVGALVKVLADRRLALDDERQRWARSKLARELGAPAEAIEVSE